ncbi:MAG: AAA family ATPase [Chloroflexi bacterium]|nr:AAA family ATPase [Chloroflexota bacterium]
MAVWQCASCGGENPEGMKFCGHCGTPAAPPSDVAPPPPAPAEPAAPAAPEPQDEREAALTAFASDRIDPTGAGMTEERRLITALFADLSGFTPLSERLDAEELLEVIDPIITALSDLVGRYGGYVEKFAGDALLALFGAPIAHEDDATRAMQVSIDMHAELAQLRQTLGENGEGLTLHIGIASGRGIARMIGSKVRMDYAVLGDSVILAQRLESATPSGETYVSQATYELAQDRFVLEPVPPLTLKGKAEPVPAWRLIGVREAGEQRSRLVGRQRTPLVGRSRELALGRAMLERLGGTTGAGGGTLAVVGEPGVGKSRLTDEVRDRAAERDIAWLEARCLSYGAGLAYWPFVDLLRRELGVASTDSPAAAETISRELGALGVPEAAPYIARLTGAATPPELEELEPEALRRGLHDAVRAWLRARAAASPLVLAVEDAHWADASSARLLEELRVLAAESPLALYVTSRPPVPGWLEAESEASAPEVLEVGQLDPEAVRELVEHQLGGSAPPELIGMVTERSAGNPFFAQEIVRSLQDAGALAEEDGRWRLRADWSAADVPATIEGVLASRLDALPPSAQGTLAVASVIGRRVVVPLLEAVIGDAAQTAADLGILVEAGLLDLARGGDGDGALMFHHALIGDVAYARLLRRRRRELHLRTAEQAEALFGTNDESIELLARHLYLGGAGARAIDYLTRAATRAARLFANDESIIHLRRAEELAAKEADAPDRLLDIRLRLGDLQELTGAYQDALDTYRRALEVRSDVRAWRGLASSHRVQGAYHEAMRVLDEAFARPDLAGQDLRPLWLERGWNLTSAEAMGEAIAALRRGLEVDPDATDPIAGQLLIELARAESYAGSLQTALEHAERSLAIAQRHDDLRAETTALRVLGLVQQSLGRLEEAADSLRRDLELARRIGSVEAIGGALINLGLVERDRGNMDEAIVCDRGAIETFERVGHGAGRAIGYANLADKLRRAGELDEAETYAHRAHDLAEEIDHAMTRADSVQILGEISLARGDFDEPAPRAAPAAAQSRPADPPPGAAAASARPARAGPPPAHDTGRP